MSEKKLIKKIKSFRKMYAPGGVSLDVLRGTVKKLGYTLVEFNHGYNNQNVQLLIDTLKLGTMISHSKGFTYVTANYRLIFLHEDLPEHEKIIVLAHEIGHVYLGHIKPESIMSSSVLEEYEANAFAHGLLNPTALEKLKTSVRCHRRAFILVLCAAIVLLAAIILVIFLPKQLGKEAGQKNVLSGEYISPQKYNLPEGTIFHDSYWVTNTGFKFHDEKCGFVKESTKSRPMTMEEFESGEYEPCTRCLKELWQAR